MGGTILGGIFGGYFGGNDLQQSLVSNLGNGTHVVKAQGLLQLKFLLFINLDFDYC